MKAKIHFAKFSKMYMSNVYFKYSKPGPIRMQGTRNFYLAMYERNYDMIGIGSDACALRIFACG